MARRCNHPVYLVDDFIDPGGAFVSCLFCPRAVELSAGALEHYIPFQHTSPQGKRHDLILLIPAFLVKR